MTRAAAALVVYAKDPTRVARFYEDVAGLRVTELDDAFILLEGAGVELVVHAIPAAIASTFEIAVPPERREDGAIKPCFTVTDLQRARQRAAVGGGLLDPAASEWTWRGLRHCDGHDPEGNVIQLRQPEADTDR
ncbi:MAG: VOC family protein [Burkholderiaceae bacterium]|nr:VOC family protein [Burkholderiaceae bacterium]